jgi:hypothetical protein
MKKLLLLLLIAPVLASAQTSFSKEITVYNPVNGSTLQSNLTYSINFKGVPYVPNGLVRIDLKKSDGSWRNELGTLPIVSSDSYNFQWIPKNNMNGSGYYQICVEAIDNSFKEGRLLLDESCSGVFTISLETSPSSINCAYGGCTTGGTINNSSANCGPAGCTTGGYVTTGTSQIQQTTITPTQQQEMIRQLQAILQSLIQQLIILLQQQAAAVITSGR